MRSCFLLLLFASGCDLLFLEEPTPGPCGPYDEIEPLVFDPGLEEPTDFSIAYDGVHGMVRARVALPANPNMTYTGPVPILDEGGTWKLDTMRFANINSFALSGGHILGEPDAGMFGWKDRTSQNPPFLNRYVFTTQWGLDATAQPLETDTSKNLRPGNEIVLPIDSGMLRFFVEIKSDYDGVMRKQIVIRQKFANDPWVTTAQAQQIADTRDIDPSSAVMSLDHDLLIYAATEAGNKSRIYASVRNRQQDQFEVGKSVELDSSDDLDDVEPWIAENCSVLYFRRGDQILRARAK